MEQKINQQSDYLGMQEDLNEPKEPREPRPVSHVLQSYLERTIMENGNMALQRSSLTNRPWGEVLSQFVRPSQIEKARRNSGELHGVINTIVGRGVELVSGGVTSHRELEGIGRNRRGLAVSGTWPDVPGGHFWHPGERQKEKKIISDLNQAVLKLDTDAEEAHVGRVITMAFPALLAFADIEGDLIPQDEMVETVVRMLDAGNTGKASTAGFGCEPYKYEPEPQSTSSHRRMTPFGEESVLRKDAIHGSFRGVLRILEPLRLSGVETSYDFYTSDGSSEPLIQRQVMPDTVNYYQDKPEEMLERLQWWHKTIEGIGREEFAGSGVRLSMKNMESHVVYPALRDLYNVLKNCGMSMPDNPDEFCYNSGNWFQEHANELNYITVNAYHPDPVLLAFYTDNENHWSSNHPEAYASEEQRLIQASLLSFFELHQYETIERIINQSTIAFGVEIDEELISRTRNRERERNRGVIQTPLIWGRPPRFTTDGEIGGVAHRQPWMYYVPANKNRIYP